MPPGTMLPGTIVPEAAAGPPELDAVPLLKGGKGATGRRFVAGDSQFVVLVGCPVAVLLFGLRVLPALPVGFARARWCWFYCVFVCCYAHSHVFTQVEITCVYVVMRIRMFLRAL